MARPPPELAAGRLADAGRFVREVVEPCRPVVIRGLVGSWPAVEAGRRSPAVFREYLSRFDAGGETEAFVGAPHIAGRYFYTDDLKAFNFERRRTSFAGCVEAIVASAGGAEAPGIYMGSVPVADYLPGFAAENPLGVLDAAVAARIWLGTPANVSPHFDALDNLACVVAGRRRFTLYPPDAIGSLYVGPVDHTMAGQPVSLAASASPPDDERYPRFRAVRESALCAELGPGDALYLPKLWWHQVESLAPFNALVNYWWDAFAAGPDAPYTSLLLSMITIAERPPEERRAWKAFFDHFVFRSDGHPLAHLPPEQRGMLGPLKPDNYRKIRAWVMHLLRGG